MKRPTNDEVENIKRKKDRISRTTKMFFFPLNVTDGGTLIYKIDNGYNMDFVLSNGILMIREASKNCF